MVVVSPARARRRVLHPLHAILLAFPFPLFLAALFSDFAYAASFQVQWTNFSQWLIAGGLLVGAIALLVAVIEARVHAAAPNWRSITYVVALFATWVAGFLNALIHAKDAWASMPAGLYLSALAALLALVAAWIGYSGLAEEVR